jgi:hypothetical protein
MLDRYKIPSGAARVASTRGEFVLWSPAPAVVMQVAVGHGSAEIAEQLVRENDRLMAGRRDVLAFFDGLAFTGYDSELRTSLAAQARRQLDAGQIKAVTVLSRSKLVAMGSAVVNLALKSRFEIVANIGVFDDRLVAAGVGDVLNPARGAVY